MADCPAPGQHPGCSFIDVNCSISGFSGSPHFSTSLPSQSAGLAVDEAVRLECSTSRSSRVSCEGAWSTIASPRTVTWSSTNAITSQRTASNRSSDRPRRGLFWDCRRPSRARTATIRSSPCSAGPSDIGWTRGRRRPGDHSSTRAGAADCLPVKQVAQSGQTPRVSGAVSGTRRGPGAHPAHLRGRDRVGPGGVFTTRPHRTERPPCPSRGRAGNERPSRSRPARGNG